MVRLEAQGVELGDGEVPGGTVRVDDPLVLADRPVPTWVLAHDRPTDEQGIGAELAAAPAVGRCLTPSGEGLHDDRGAVLAVVVGERLLDGVAGDLRGSGAGVVPPLVGAAFDRAPRGRCLRPLAGHLLALLDDVRHLAVRVGEVGHRVPRPHPRGVVVHEPVAVTVPRAGRSDDRSLVVLVVARLGGTPVGRLVEVHRGEPVGQQLTFAVPGGHHAGNAPSHAANTVGLM